MAITLYIKSGRDFCIEDLRHSIPSCKAIAEYDRLRTALRGLVEKSTKAHHQLFLGIEATDSDLEELRKAIAAAEAAERGEG